MQPSARRRPADVLRTGGNFQARRAQRLGAENHRRPLRARGTRTPADPRHALRARARTTRRPKNPATRRARPSPRHSSARAAFLALAQARVALRQPRARAPRPCSERSATHPYRRPPSVRSPCRPWRPLRERTRNSATVFRRKGGGSDGFMRHPVRRLTNPRRHAPEFRKRQPRPQSTRARYRRHVTPIHASHAPSHGGMLRLCEREGGGFRRGWRCRGYGAEIVEPATHDVRLERGLSNAGADGKRASQ